MTMPDSTTAADQAPRRVPPCVPPDLWDTLGEPGKPSLAIVGSWCISEHAPNTWAAVPLGRRLYGGLDPLFPTARAAAEALQAHLDNA